jgi:hypothetical protein
MRIPRQRSPSCEQLELFAEETKRPAWRSLPRETRQHISDLIAQMLLQLREDDTKSGKEVDHARED